MSNHELDSHFIGPMGSEFWQICVPPKAVPIMATRLDWNQMGRRVVIDPTAGIISWMNPSPGHACMSDASDSIVKEAEYFIKKRIKSMRDTRWKRPEDHENVGFEPDASFYIGEKAERCYEAFRSGGDEAVNKFAENNPPDLVVEVEVTHLDKNKPAHYALIGVQEMWRATQRKDKNDYRTEVSILELQTNGGPRIVEQSLVLPRLKAASLPKAFMLVQSGLHDELRSLLAKELVTPFR